MDFCTFHEGNVYGIDTNHGHNMNMTLDERYVDAKKQIKALIKHYNKIRGDMIVKKFMGTIDNTLGKKQK